MLVLWHLHRLDVSLSYLFRKGYLGSQGVLKETVPRFELPHSLQRDNGSSFTSQITQGMVKGLGIKYHLHSVWQLQSSEKAEKAKQTLIKLWQNSVKRNLSPGSNCYQQHPWGSFSPFLKLSQVWAIWDVIQKPIFMPWYDSRPTDYETLIISLQSGPSTTSYPDIWEQSPASS